MEWDYSGRKGRDGQKKKTGKANNRKRKVKGENMRSKWTRGKRGAPAPHGAAMHEQEGTIQLFATAKCPFLDILL